MTVERATKRVQQGVPTTGTVVTVPNGVTLNSKAHTDCQGRAVHIDVVIDLST